MMNNTSFLGSFSMPVDSPSSQTMIKVDHVTMIFNIASEQLNSLKEYAIALAKHELRFKEFRALNDISFEVKQGDVFGILGTNGSGKSTMLKIIAGVLDPSEGSCIVRGSIAPLIELGAGFDLELTARENIFLNGALLGYSKDFIKDHFDEIVEFAEVNEFLDMPMKNYSSGMVARIAFAIATVIVPDVLIVDEVLSVGDFLFQQKCERRIQSLINDHGVTVLIVSHSNEQIERLCNKAVWIEKGHLRAIGAAKDVCELYRAIGGRPGSPEAERTILETVDANIEPPSKICSCVFGENLYGTSIAFDNLCSTVHNTYILTNGESEREGRIACGLSGALGASLVATKSDQIPDILQQNLQHHQPRTIIVLGDEQHIAASVVSSLTTICPNSEIIRLESQDSACGLDTYRYGASSAASWGRTAILARDGFDAALITLSPYIYARKAPVFYLDDAKVHRLVERVVESFDELIFVGYKDEGSLPIKLHRKSSSRWVFFAESEPNKANDKVNRWLHPFFEARSHEKKASDILLITDPHCEMDNNFIGPLSGELHSRIALISIQNLNEVARGISLLKHMNNPPARLLFIGSSLRYTDFDKALFSKALCLNPAFTDNISGDMK
ncbi:MAG: ABC transporter ATP-binding protein [Eggerthellaceae bacterium]|nr:ABC transporter ATP-binding protein [Eggerthellaceae bacterium]